MRARAAARRESASARRPERVPADETQQLGLALRTAGHLDSVTELAGGAQNLFHLLHPTEELRAEVGVQPVVLASRSRKIPGVHEHVGRIDLVDRGFQR